MKKFALLLAIGFIALAAQPAAAVLTQARQGNSQMPPKMEQPAQLPIRQQDPELFEAANQIRNEQRLSIEGQAPEAAAQVRQQVEVRQEIMRDGLEENLLNRREQIETMTQAQRQAIEQKIEQRREEVKNKLASKSAQMSQNAQQHMSVVAQRVQELHELADNNAGLGPQIREIAQSQQSAQASTAAQLKRVENRNRLLKFLIGADDEALEQLNYLQTANEERIVELQVVLDGTNDEEARVVIENTIESLEEQNQLISLQVEQEGKTFSLFGWVMQIFNR